MKMLAFALMLLSFSSAFAKPHIVDVSPGVKSGEDHMIMWSNGKVTFEKVLPKFKKEKQLFPEVSPMMMSYEPTIVESEAAALKLLKSMRRPNLIQWNIQCYNMAHVRAYEMFKYHNVKSQKMFLFFTKSYIRKYRFKWWFHVTPMVLVNGEERILDPEWSKTPLAVKTWTDKYIKPKTACPVISKFSSYEQNQETSNCYVYPAPMYYWQPIHLMELEESRQEMGSFNMGEVNTAYRRDF